MNIKVREYAIYDDNIPKELSGYRMALFSDTHNNFYGKDSEILINRIDCISPDIVLFAGDGNCTNHASDDPNSGFDNSLNLFTNLAKKYPLYYVPGNHEHRLERLCNEQNNDSYIKYIEKLTAAGVNYLINESKSVLDGKICITGLDMPLESYRSIDEISDVKQIAQYVSNSKKDAYNILLTHAPVFLKEYAEWGADLVLCGHMHGGMIRLPIIGGVLSPYRTFFPKYDYGYFEEYNSKMIVSSGAGDHNIRFKLCNPYEIVSIILKAKE